MALAWQVEVSRERFITMGITQLCPESFIWNSHNWVENLIRRTLYWVRMERLRAEPGLGSCSMQEDSLCVCHARTSSVGGVVKGGRIITIIIICYKRCYSNHDYHFHRHLQ